MASTGSSNRFPRVSSPIFEEVRAMSRFPGSRRFDSPLFLAGDGWELRGTDASRPIFETTDTVGLELLMQDAAIEELYTRSRRTLPRFGLTASRGWSIARRKTRRPGF